MPFLAVNVASVNEKFARKSSRLCPIVSGGSILRAIVARACVAFKVWVPRPWFIILQAEEEGFTDRRLCGEIFLSGDLRDLNERLPFLRRDAWRYALVGMRQKNPPSTRMSIAKLLSPGTRLIRRETLGNYG